MSDAAEKINRREQVKELIATGEFTKAEIATKLEVSAASVSSQMTYLRWMGNFIKYDADKKLAFCTEEEYTAWQESLNANRKTKTAAARTPEEQAKATFVAGKRHESALAGWQKKLDQITKDLEADSDDEALLELEAEAQASITLLQIKIKRNAARASELPDYVPGDDTPEVSDADVDAPEGDEELM